MIKFEKSFLGLHEEYTLMFSLFLLSVESMSY